MVLFSCCTAWMLEQRVAMKVQLKTIEDQFYHNHDDADDEVFEPILDFINITLKIKFLLKIALSNRIDVAVQLFYLSVKLKSSSGAGALKLKLSSRVRMLLFEEMEVVVQCTMDGKARWRAESLDSLNSPNGKMRNSNILILILIESSLFAVIQVTLCLFSASFPSSCSNNYTLLFPLSQSHSLIFSPSLFSCVVCLENTVFRPVIASE